MNARAFLPSTQRQRGAAIVEFSLVCLLFFTLVLFITELGRMLYLYNTMQEVTRRGAREAVTRWVTDAATVKTNALFGGSTLPAAPELTTAKISIKYLNAAGNEVTNTPLDAGDNLSACNDALRVNDCIYSVSVSLENVTYVPIVNLFGMLNVTMPTTKVVMYAESLGFTN